MDNSVERAWATPRVAAGAMGVAGVVLLAVGAVTAADAIGMVLVGVAGLLLLGFGSYAWFVRPRLAVSVTPTPVLTVRTLSRTCSYPIDRVDRVRLLSTRRIGRRAGQLEIDVLPDDAPPAGAVTEDGPREDTRLIVFSRWDLGADLLDVADTLRRAGFGVDDTR